MNVLFGIFLLFTLPLSALANADIYKCVVDGRTTYGQKECPPPIQDAASTKRLNDKAASHGFDGFLDPSGGKRLTCAEAVIFDKEHDSLKTKSLCMINGMQARERERKRGRSATRVEQFLDACVEGTCRVGVWRDVTR